MPPPLPLSPSRSNTPAVAGFVLGLLGCIPLLTGILAVVFSTAGLRKARQDPLATGRGFAIAGLILGSLSILAWCAIGGGGYAIWAGTAELRDAGKQFVRDVANHQPDAAAARCTPDITPADLQQLVDVVQPLGSLADITGTNVAAQAVNGQTTATFDGHADFTAGRVTFHLALIKQSGQWKITGAKFDRAGQ